MWKLGGGKITSRHQAIRRRTHVSDHKASTLSSVTWLLESRNTHGSVNATEGIVWILDVLFGAFSMALGFANLLAHIALE